MNDTYIGVMIGAAVGVCLSLIFYKFAKRSKAPSQLGSQQERLLVYATPNQHQRHIAELRQNLRLKFMYDEAKIDRAIDLERKRIPNVPLEELMQAAIERWERDNR